MATSVICKETVSRVSSVLNRDVKQFGKHYMFDCNEETCWNSDQGDLQWVLLDFPKPVKISTVNVQFQGGFAGKTCRLEGSLKDEAFANLTVFYPEDNNNVQSFPIGETPSVQRLKIVFENSTDFFGRIIVYSLDVLGERT
ncbi:nuclear receptor 2C2-associated protein [Paramormyrops kingsleyae]|uniref:Nuclear receptor 2C2-associated protein n=1 Tax=Paramormyrops kingsleyae TaxID=1676925 RepID=A0A3B3QQS2_9TELE|nr:nuclear receptor 2C2-associated protein [Paramormyrops kingsleyae]